MILQHVNVKIPVGGGWRVAVEDVIATFHGWVSEQGTDELLIDVADYSHVPDGPGVVLVGLEADYSIDHAGGLTGMRYNCKAARDGDNAARVLHALQSALSACVRLEEAFDGLAFDRQLFQVFINDRALARNAGEQVEDGRAELGSAVRAATGDDNCQLEFEQDPRRLLGATVRLSSPLVEAPVG